MIIQPYPGDDELGDRGFPDPENDWITVGEAARMMRTTTDAFREHEIDQGHLPARRNPDNNRWLVRRSDVVALRQAGPVRFASTPPGTLNDWPKPRRRGPRLTTGDYRRISLAHAQGVTVFELASRHECSPSTIRHIVNQAGRSTPALKRQIVGAGQYGDADDGHQGDSDVDG